MTLAINTAHALYPNIVSLIVIDGGVLKDLKVPSRTFNNASGTTFGSGTYGQHFKTLASGPYSPGGTVLSPAIEYDTNTTPLSYFIAFNDLETNGRFLGHTSGNSSFLPNFSIISNNAAVALGYSGGLLLGTSVDVLTGTTPHTIAVVRQPGDTTGNTFYVDKVSQGSASFSYSNSGQSIDYLGGEPGQVSMTASMAFIVFFNKELSSTEVATLHDSLTGSGSFALVTGTQGSSASAVTLSGPSSGTTGVASTNFTVGANATISGSVTVTPSDGSSGGTFTPTSVTISSGSPTATFTYTPASTGIKIISVTNNGSLTNPTNINYTSNAVAATAVNISGPSTCVVNVASSNFTVTANGSISGSVTVTPSDSSGGGTFTPTSVTISSGSPTATFKYTAASSGTKVISVTNNTSLTNPGALNVTASIVTATSLYISGPTSGVVGTQSSDFTIAANGSLSGSVTITLSDSSGGGTFTPTTVTISSGSPTATFKYTASTLGVKSITITNNGSLTNPATISYVSSVSTTVRPIIFLIDRNTGAVSFALPGSLT